MLSIFLSKKMPVGLPEKADRLQQTWNAFLLKMEELSREIIDSGNHDQLPAIIKKARNAYQSQALSKYKALLTQYKNNKLATDLLNHSRDKIHHVLLQWEQRLIFLQEKALRGNSPERTYKIVGSNDDGIIFYTYYGVEERDGQSARIIS
jgi:hypothetical protein